MVSGISILIPTYNDLSLGLAKTLSSQADAARCDVEIIVADDGSTNKEIQELNRRIATLPHCRFIERKTNCGRSAIRNYLVTTAKHEWIVFTDGDMSVDNDMFIDNYAECDEDDVAYGGYKLPDGGKTMLSNLRYKYERKCMPMHTVEKRSKDPYKDFHTSNFMARKKILLDIPFDENFTQYGYEDVFWGKILQQKGYKIKHIDNPVVFDRFECNSSFISKTEEGLRTLFAHRNELHGFSRIISTAQRLNQLYLTKAFLLTFNALENIIKRNIEGNKPSLFLFKIYRLGYYLKQK